MMQVPLFKVFIPESAGSELLKTLYSGFIGQGPKVEEFEALLKDFFNWPYLITVNSGTTAIELALHMIGVGPGDEVISTALTCQATNQPIFHTGAKIVWADVELATNNIDLDDAARKITDKTKAIVVVAWGGNPVDVAKLRNIIGTRNIEIVYDCAHAFGSKDSNGHQCGTTDGTYGCFSLQAIKTLTTGDGGILTLPSEQAYRRAKLLRWYGIDREDKTRIALRCEEDLKEPGFKAHMNDLNATIGIAQMSEVNNSLCRSRENAQFYTKQLAGVQGIVGLPKDCGHSSYWLYTMRVERRPDFIKALAAAGIGANQVHMRNDVHSYLAAFKTDLPNLDLLDMQHVSIPVGRWVGQAEREYIVDTIKKGW